MFLYSAEELKWKYGKVYKGMKADTKCLTKVECDHYLAESENFLNLR